MLCTRCRTGDAARRRGPSGRAGARAGVAGAVGAEPGVGAPGGGGGSAGRGASAIVLNTPPPLHPVCLFVTCS